MQVAHKQVARQWMKAANCVGEKRVRCTPANRTFIFLCIILKFKYWVPIFNAANSKLESLREHRFLSGWHFPFTCFQALKIFLTYMYIYTFSGCCLATPGHQPTWMPNNSRADWFLPSRIALFSPGSYCPLLAIIPPLACADSYRLIHIHTDKQLCM